MQFITTPNGDVECNVVIDKAFTVTKGVISFKDGEYFFFPENCKHALASNDLIQIIGMMVELNYARVCRNDSGLT
jgi:hypothetical protein